MGWRIYSKMVSGKITVGRFQACVGEQGMENEGSWEQEKWFC
jgi:hypothetical protein